MKGSAFLWAVLVTVIGLTLTYAYNQQRNALDTMYFNQALRETESFIKETSNSAYITSDQYEAFIMKIASYGGLYDVDVYKNVKIVNPAVEEGRAAVSYIRDNDFSKFDVGDYIVVSLTPIRKSQVAPPITLNARVGGSAYR